MSVGSTILFLPALHVPVPAQHDYRYSQPLAASTQVRNSSGHMGSVGDFQLRIPAFSDHKSVKLCDDVGVESYRNPHLPYDIIGDKVLKKSKYTKLNLTKTKLRIKNSFSFSYVIIISCLY